MQGWIRLYSRSNPLCPLTLIGLQCKWSVHLLAAPVENAPVESKAIAQHWGWQPPPQQLGNFPCLPPEACRPQLPASAKAQPVAAHTSQGRAPAACQEEAAACCCDSEVKGAALLDSNFLQAGVVIQANSPRQAEKGRKGEVG